ncbi:hypothetical protein DERP_001626 [Dermatophagoides pteronyssinus]|uniref:Uncharacterized protein n=1 Tax=Dermatophagoides pteronyssinus TaxID=6956 RepID=A0ABQ8JB19_DERPT|nr:hypothetical protein DERP_001626 [Dermatophagoides pteronyssinus]
MSGSAVGLTNIFDFLGGFGGATKSDSFYDNKDLLIIFKSAFSMRIPSVKDEESGFVIFSNSGWFDVEVIMISLTCMLGYKVSLFPNDDDVIQQKQKINQILMK